MNHWKIAAIGTLALSATSVISVVTTAYLMRPPAAHEPPIAAVPASTNTLERRAPVVHIAPTQQAATPRRTVLTTPAGVTRRPERVAPASPVSTSEPPVVSQPAPSVATSRPEPAAATPQSMTPVPVPAASPEPAVAPTAPSPANAAPAADCDASGRTARIAKPGLLGALAGAALGAAGGAITNGGKGAGKGAALGGLAGAALGSGYGAYKTKNECGAILGSPTQAPLTTSGAGTMHVEPVR